LFLPPVELIQTTTEEQIEAARELFKEYAAGLAIDMCFQSFDLELQTLPGKYAMPDGRLLLAYADDELAGCIALRKLDDRTCEMKRLFLRPGFRGRGYGRRMINKLIEVAREIGYQRMVLDTLPGKMDAAISLYRELGFEEIPAYYYNPLEGAVYLERAI
jgi:ribosomal protein S18 acetylase RimI-like enzyme